MLIQVKEIQFQGEERKTTREDEQCEGCRERNIDIYCCQDCEVDM
jgi:hypothetical protein